MKVSAKPISSPSRTDKFPTPLMMRFLRSNVGSRSRGRSRSSPMFIMRTKRNAAVINDAQQEPSSPKVTCIGQVRARRSSKANKNSRSKRLSSSLSSPKQVLPHQPCSFYSASSCRCVPRIHLCCHFSTTPRLRTPRSFCRFFRKCLIFFRFGYCKKVDTRDDCSSRVESSIPRDQNQVNQATSNVSDIEDNEKNVAETTEDFLESSSPPKNALLLTRCRSAPYRSSSLAYRFWGSPVRTSETETDKSPKKELHGPPISPNYGNEAVESRNSSSHEGSGSEELDSSSKGRTIKANIQDMRAIGILGGGTIHPLLLTRCKSEPARIGERLNPEANFWRQRRSHTTESYLQENSNCD